MAYVRLFAAAAEVLGTDALTIEASNTGELRQKLKDSSGITVRNIIDQCSLLVDGSIADDDTTGLNLDSRVDVLPPFAGG